MLLEILFIVMVVLAGGGLFISVICWDEFYPWLWKNITGNYLGARKYGHTYNEVKGLSTRATKILVDNRNLPEEHRLGDELLVTLRNLDLKHGGKKKVNSHYCIHSDMEDCPMAEYHNISRSIDGIEEALEAQKARLAELATQGVVVDTELLIERARKEAEIIRDTTKELS